MAYLNHFAGIDIFCRLFVWLILLKINQLNLFSLQVVFISKNIFVSLYYE